MIPQPPVARPTEIARPVSLSAHVNVSAEETSFSSCSITTGPSNCHAPFGPIFPFLPFSAPLLKRRPHVVHAQSSLPPPMPRQSSSSASIPFSASNAASNAFTVAAFISPVISRKPAFADHGHDGGDRKPDTAPPSAHAIGGVVSGSRSGPG